MTMRGQWVAAWALVGLAACCAAALAGEKKPEFDPELPPCVVKTEPADRAKDVDSNLREIKVTFDRPMNTGEFWSWMILQDQGVYPGYRGSDPPRWLEDGRTCVLQVRLSPDTVYAIGVNGPRNTGFRDAKGKVAVPYAWVFKTKN
jgi:hypothetical protein